MAVEADAADDHKCPVPLFREPVFLDLFAGAGCLSLGLMQTGWSGLLAVEKNEMAFATLAHNLVGRFDRPAFAWPEWYPKQARTVRSFVTKFRQELQSLAGVVTMVVGGPPCQGFSLAGRRQSVDPRNALFADYLRVVRVLRPLLILLENVRGITVAFSGSAERNRKKAYSDRIAGSLEDLGYRVFSRLVRAADYGVPQFRPRYFIAAVLEDAWPTGFIPDPFELMAGKREQFLSTKGLPISVTVSVRAALSDLEITHGTVDSPDTPGFRHGVYAKASSHYQELMRAGREPELPDSHRLANHRPETTERFAEILATCRRGVQLNHADRSRLGLKKSCVVPLHPEHPSHTLTTLPDDIIHYCEPRILTVREYARLQSIPDWFEFKGMYTTGGHRRVKQTPRYTQAGNAVPPFVAQAMGEALLRVHSDYVSSWCRSRSRGGSSADALQPQPLGR